MSGRTHHTSSKPAAIDAVAASARYRAAVTAFDVSPEIKAAMYSYAYPIEGDADYAAKHAAIKADKKRKQTLTEAQKNTEDIQRNECHKAAVMLITQNLYPYGYENAPELAQTVYDQFFPKKLSSALLTKLTTTSDCWWIASACVQAAIREEIMGPPPAAAIAAPATSSGPAFCMACNVFTKLSADNLCPHCAGLSSGQ